MIRAGFDACLNKPFIPNKLLEAIQSALQLTFRMARFVEAQKT
jgi:CheY-like chemotaxis protein